MFAYCLNNPVNMADPDGNIAWWIVGGAIGAVAGGIAGAIISYKATGSVNWKYVAGGVAAGALTGMGIGAAASYFAASSAMSVVAGGGSVWGMNALQRGNIIERALGGMCNNFPTIDKFVRGARGFASSITSIKSLDTFASSYQRGNAIYNTIMGYANSLSRFASTRWGGITVNVNSSTQRILELAVPSNITSAQMAQVNRAIGDAARIGVNLVVKYIK